MKVGIWGGGFIGGHLATTLASRGVETCILGRGATDNPATASGRTTRQMAFSATEAEMARAMSGLSLLVHCAGSATDGYDEYFSATTQMARAAVTAKLERVILLSTVAVYGAALPQDGAGAGEVMSKSVVPLPLTPYARSRYKTEIETRHILEEGGVELIVVRIPMAVGPRMNATVFKKLTAILEMGIFPRLSAQPAVLPCIGIRRLSECLAYLVREPKGGEPLYQFSNSVAWLDIVDLLKRHMGRRILIVRIPGQWLQRLASYCGLHRIASTLSSLMNVVQYEDDAGKILSATETIRLTTWSCVEQSILELGKA